jgi:hypothetical protein
VFVLWTGLSGYLFKFALYLTGATLPFSGISALLDFFYGIDPADQMSGFDIDKLGYKTPTTLAEVFSGGIGDLAHWVLGLVGIALYGFVSVMSGIGTFGIHIRLGAWRRDGERRRRGTIGGIMWGIIILIGTAKWPSSMFPADCRTLRAIYVAVDTWIRKYQAKAETAILEVDADGE